jgi:hypothetical protein
MVALATKSTKQVQVIARIAFKSDARKVVYLVRASNGVDQYQVSLFAGQVSGCSCVAHKPCYHMKQVQKLEDNRVALHIVASVEEKAPIVEETPTTCPIVAPDRVYWTVDFHNHPIKLRWDEMTSGQQDMQVQSERRAQFEELFGIYE